ncbi:MAG: YceI family protein [Chitinophagales bacterium]
MNKLLSIAFLLVALSTQAQDKFASTWMCKAGKVHFFSSTPMEDIEATSNTALCALDTTSKKVYAQIKITSFTFPSALMQDHFNENYMESGKYPMSELNGVIVEDIDFKKDGVYDVTFRGTLEMHGVKHQRDIKVKLTIKGGQPVNASGSFDVRLADHKIEVPTAVFTKIAESIKVDVNFDFTKYSKS